MNTLRRVAKLIVLVVLGATVVGCCVAPPYGWGRYHRAQGGYYQGDAVAGPARGADMPRGGATVYVR
jgi:hypothetical protein